MQREALRFDTEFAEIVDAAFIHEDEAYHESSSDEEEDASHGDESREYFHGTTAHLQTTALTDSDEEDDD